MKCKQLMMTLFSLVMIVAAIGAIDLTESQAIAYALDNNGSLQLALLDNATNSRAKQNSYSGLLPSFSVSTTLNLSDSNLFGANVDPMLTWANNFSLSWNFNPALIYNMDIANQKYQAGLITYEEKKQQTILNVRKLFYALLLQQEGLALQERSLAQTQARLEQVQQSYHFGYVPELTVLQAQSNYDAMAASLEKQKQSLVQQKRTLSLLLGLDPEMEINLVGSLELVAYEIPSDSLGGLSNRFDIASLDMQRQTLQLQEQALKMQVYVPNINLSASYAPTILDVTKDWSGNISPITKNFSDKGGIGITVAMNLTNLLPASSARQGLADVQDAISKIGTTSAMLRQNATVEILNLLVTIEQAQIDIASSERTIELAQKIYSLTEQSYQHGSSEYLDVRDAQLQLDQAQLARLSNQYAYYSALLDLEYAMQRSIIK